MVSVYRLFGICSNFLNGRNVVIVENGVKLRLNIVDTPGYGDQINNENWYVLPSMPCPLCPIHTVSHARASR